VLSGLGGSNWAPVHEFCEHQAIPCLFPNVEVPVVADHDFYSLYFSKAVLLEAQLIAKAMAGDAHPGQVAVQQIYRAGDSGEPAAAALAAELKERGFTVSNESLPTRAPKRVLTAAVSHGAASQILVLWLRPADIAALGPATPGRVTVYMSGLMGGLEDSPLPAGWRTRTLMAYPFDLPDKRGVRLDYPLGWFKFRHIPVVAQQVQADTYLACGLVSETVNHMVDAFVREYLIERVEMALDHRALTGYYPRLTLAPGQRFASKGGYIVRFADPAGARLTPVGEWITP